MVRQSPWSWDYPGVSCLDLTALPINVAVALDCDCVWVCRHDLPRAERWIFYVDKHGKKHHHSPKSGTSHTRLPWMPEGTDPVARARALASVVRVALKKAGLPYVAVTVRPPPWPVYRVAPGMTRAEYDTFMGEEKRLGGLDAYQVPDPIRPVDDREWDGILAKKLLPWGVPRRCYDGRQELEWKGRV